MAKHLAVSRAPPGTIQTENETIQREDLFFPQVLQRKIIRTYNIQTTWDGQPINHDPIKITVGPVESTGHVMLSASGPFFNDSERPPNSTVGEPYYGLWNYEAVEVFFLNDENHLLNTILSPYRLDYFQLIDFKEIVPDNWSQDYTSSEWN
ncbi:UPF0462 protein C4orf33 homolog [Mya arenaria]|uniref:UPF0462 protein C4orf33 homolog n=1 Tax=Mya arenaria TaxID=6604 RepID=UPI0022E37855|nr:UPF0462 protein C4orf33 homolog [Mya arenaria]